MIPILLLIAFSQKQLSDQPSVLDGGVDIYAGDFVFFSTPFGIYTFNRSTATWNRTAPARSVLEDRIRIMALDDGVLWLATSLGLASADIKLWDWQSHELSGIEGITFDDEYVWAGGDFGLKRFDKYREIWEDVADLKINHMIREGNIIWCATDIGIYSYNKDFEKIETVPDAPHYAYSYIVGTPSIVWFIASDYFVAYRKDNKSWTTYAGRTVNDYSDNGDSLFILSDGMVYLYEPKGAAWVQVRDIEDKGVHGIHVQGNNLLCATDHGLFIYDMQEKTRTYYNRTNGLATDSLLDCYQDLQHIFAISNKAIEFYDTTINVWRLERLTALSENKKLPFSIDETGGHANLGELALKLQGRTYYSQTRTITDSVTTVDYETITMQLIAEHESNRLLSLYYDDTDKEQELYGFGYRGLPRDILFRSNAGYVESEYYEFDILPQFSTLGGNARLNLGKHGMMLQGGQLKSELHKQFFTGRETEIDMTLFDTDYRSHTFYSIYSVPLHIVRDVDTIFVDDRSSSSNAIDTRMGLTIGGITGDFDPFINGQDYFIDYKNGIIHFLSQRSARDIIVLFLNRDTIVIQSDEVLDRALENTYFIGPGILPHSLSITITDTLGTVHPLYEFGLDNDTNGVVDANYINYDLGFLAFPERRPFPDPVYDDALHIYSFSIHFATRLTFYRLTHTPIQKNSEIVLIDGERLTRNTDYIVDYSSGTLVFLKEYIVSDFSELEIQYSSVERTRTDRFFSVQPHVNIGTKLHVAPGFSTVAGENIFHVSARYETPPAQNGITFIPQIAMNDNHALAHTYSLLYTQGMLNVHTEYRGYSRAFESFGAQEKKYGTLQHHGSVSARIEPYSTLRCDVQSTRDYMNDSLNTAHIAQYNHVNVSYLNPRLPHASVLWSRDFLPDYDKVKVHVSSDYEFRALSSFVKLSSYVNNETVDYGAATKRAFEYLFNTHCELPVAVRTDLNFRRIAVFRDESKERIDEDLRATAYIDVIPGMYYTGDYNLKVITSKIEHAEDLDTKAYFFNTVHIAPGRWYLPLSIINVSYGVGSSFDGYTENLPAEYARPFVFFNPLDTGSVSSIDNVDTYYLTAHCTPFSRLLIWAKHAVSKSGFAYYALPEQKQTLQDILRIEFEPAHIGFFVMSWDRKITRRYPVETIHAGYGEWNKPWGAHLRTKTTLDYRYTEDDYGTALVKNSELKASLEFLLRFASKSFVTARIGGARQRNYLSETTYSVIPGAGFNVNLFTFLYLQGSYTSTFTLHNDVTHTLSATIIGQF